jgi:hypothetical protein
MSLAAGSIHNILASPSKVAHCLDWTKASGAILSLRIVRDCIDLAVSSHPEVEEEAHNLPSIPLEFQIINNRKVLMPKVTRELTDVIHKYNVCGMVVSWPIQTEGWCGKSCGKVLHTLDQLVGQLPKRPICLFDPKHISPPEDEWGRAKFYSEPVNKTLHVASKEQYTEDHTTTTGKVASDIWKQFCQEQWPGLCALEDRVSTSAAHHQPTSFVQGKMFLQPAKSVQYDKDSLEEEDYATAIA